MGIFLTYVNRNRIDGGFASRTRIARYFRYLFKSTHVLSAAILVAVLARKDCDIVVSSIFVNPAQFAPTEDLDKYPKTLDHDLKVLGQAGADYVFVPSVSALSTLILEGEDEALILHISISWLDEIYPAGIPLDVSKQVGTFVSVQGL